MWAPPVHSGYQQRETQHGLHGAGTPVRGLGKDCEGRERGNGARRKKATGPALTAGQERQRVRGVGRWSVSGARRRGARATWRPLRAARADLRTPEPRRAFVFAIV